MLATASTDTEIARKFVGFDATEVATRTERTVELASAYQPYPRSSDMRPRRGTPREQIARKRFEGVLLRGIVKRLDMILVRGR